MTDVTINPLRSTTIGEARTAADQADRKVRPDAAARDTGRPAGDTVTLSLAARSLAKPAATGDTALSETEAAATADSLREQLKTAPLSSSARQNQAILSLLR